MQTMQQHKNKFKFGFQQLIYLALIIGFFTAMVVPVHSNIPAGQGEESSTFYENGILLSDSGKNKNPQMEQESKAAFLKAYTVFMHPRCMNCHPAGDVPLQGDDSHAHLQGVKRGVDGKGLYAMKCKNCHQDANLKGPNLPPGMPDWKLPPANRKMVFQGKTPRELALQFKDNNFTGFKNLNEMIKHVEKADLVVNSFVPLEGKSRLPMSHQAFVGYVKEWLAKGAAVPDK